jgi:hypothetical protein
MGNSGGDRYGFCVTLQQKEQKIQKTKKNPNNRVPATQLTVDSQLEN